MTYAASFVTHNVNLSELVGHEGQLHVLLTSAAQARDKKAMSCLIRMGDLTVPLAYPSAQAVGEVKLVLQPLEEGQAQKHVSIKATPQGQWKMTIVQQGNEPIEHIIPTVMEVPLCMSKNPEGAHYPVRCHVVSTEIKPPAMSPPPPPAPTPEAAPRANVWRRSSNGAGFVGR